MRLAQALLGGIALSALAACTPPLEQLREQRPVGGSAFTHALTAAYLELSESEAAQYDWWDAYHFARKGLAAARGEVVLPDHPSEWRIRIERPEVLEAARDRLLAALDANARERDPETAARAQISYDCWLENLEQGWRPDLIGACRDAFETALAAIEAAPPAPPAAAVVAPPAPAAVEADPFQVYFDFAGTELSPLAMGIVEQAVAAARQAGAERFLVIGHADAAGSAAANLRVSAQRADAVRRALIGLGVPAAAVETLAAGASDPAVETPAGAREPHNRRAVIRFR